MEPSKSCHSFCLMWPRHFVKSGDPLGDGTPLVISSGCKSVSYIIWLVVSTPLKNISQSMGRMTSHNMPYMKWKIKILAIFETTNQLFIEFNRCVCSSIFTHMGNSCDSPVRWTGSSQHLRPQSSSHHGAGEKNPAGSCVSDACLDISDISSPSCNLQWFWVGSPSLPSFGVILCSEVVVVQPGLSEASSSLKFHQWLQWSHKSSSTVFHQLEITWNYLVGGFNPPEKYQSVGVTIPNIWKNKKMFQTTSQLLQSFFCHQNQQLDQHHSPYRRSLVVICCDHNDLSIFLQRVAKRFLDFL